MTQSGRRFPHASLSTLRTSPAESRTMHGWNAGRSAVESQDASSIQRVESSQLVRAHGGSVRKRSFKVPTRPRRQGSNASSFLTHHVSPTGVRPLGSTGFCGPWNQSRRIDPLQCASAQVSETSLSLPIACRSFHLASANRPFEHGSSDAHCDATFSGAQVQQRMKHVLRAKQRASM